jgi:hypothetical protein
MSGGRGDGWSLLVGQLYETGTEGRKATRQS